MLAPIPADAPVTNAILPSPSRLPVIRFPDRGAALLGEQSRREFPIRVAARATRRSGSRSQPKRPSGICARIHQRVCRLCPVDAARSEERRVGKECRSRWSPEHEKKKGGNARGGGESWR